MAILGRARTATGAGVITTLILVLLFGNQAFTEWVGKHANPDTVWGWFLRKLAWPAWAVGLHDESTSQVRDLLAQDLRALLLVAFVAAVLGISSQSLSGGGGAFIPGWVAVVLRSALAAVFIAVIPVHALRLGGLHA